MDYFPKDQNFSLSGNNFQIAFGAFDIRDNTPLNDA